MRPARCIVRLGKPIGRPPEGRSDYVSVTTNIKRNGKLFLRDSAISRPDSLFFHIFSAMTEKIWPSETPRAIPALYFTLFSVG